METAEFIARVIGPTLALFGAVLIWLMQRRHEARQKAAQEQERQRRMLIALRAELLIAVEYYDAFFGPTVVEDIKAALLNTIEQGTEAVTMPIGYAANSDIVFAAVRDEIADIPADVIAPVIRYYLADSGLSGTLDSFADPRYEKISVQRRKAAVSGYMSEGARTLSEAKRAFKEIDRYLADDPDAVRLRATEAETLDAVGLADNSASNPNPLGSNDNNRAVDGHD